MGLLRNIREGVRHAMISVPHPASRPMPTPDLAGVRWLDTTPQDSTDEACGIDSLDIVAQVSGLYAEVTQTLVIRNPNTRPISVPVAIPMPDGAVVSGFALDIDGTLVDGVVVEKERARVAFETEQRRGADPGLVEAVRGNVYRTRVYPVPPSGTRTVRLTYVAPLLLTSDGEAILDLPMPAERLGHRTLRIDVEQIDASVPVVRGTGTLSLQDARGFWTLTSEEEDLMPEGPVRVALPELPRTLVLLERDDEGTVWFSASERTDDVPTPVELTSLTILWDASGSRAYRDHDQELRLLRAYGEAEDLDTLTFVSFADRVLESRTCSSVDELVELAQGVSYDGGTHLPALAHALADVRGACVLFTDGLDTLSDEVFTMPDGCDVLAVVSGTERDMESMRQVCRGLAFDVATAPCDARELAELLGDRSRRFLRIRGTGIADVSDAGTFGRGRRAVIGRLTADQASITLGDTATPLVLHATDARAGKVLGRAWAARRVAQLSPRATDYADELLELGRRFGVVSPVTSLIVLEDLIQWVEHDIEPPATLPELRSLWRQLKRGEMLVSTEEEQRDAHRRNLVHAWKELLAWWARDYAHKADPNSPTQLGLPTRCPRCGTEVEADALTCYHCGTFLEAAYRRSAPAAGDTGAFAPLRTESVRMAAPAVLDSLPDALPDTMMGASSFDAQPTESFADAMPLYAAESAADISADLFEEEALPDSAPAPSARTAESPVSTGPTMKVTVRPWMPGAPYLKELDAASVRGVEVARACYREARSDYRLSPSFFLDCAGWFMAHDDASFGLRVLSNLAEMRIEDAALLRVMGWRLREAGELAQALVVFRRIQRLRGEDAQSYRDLALVLDELARETFAAGEEDVARAYAEEAGELYRHIASTPWPRRALAVGLFAVEEYNVLRAWAEAQSWTRLPELPSLGEDLEGVLACDLRITLAWDADETDVDIHVTEPSGEEVYYGHRNSYWGGRVSEDITDGYGPELYEIRAAREGVYRIRAHYYASHQQVVFGPATCTLTVYTDWGRLDQARRVTSRRLDRQKEMVDVGMAAYGDVPELYDPDAGDTASIKLPPERLVELGMSREEVEGLLEIPPMGELDAGAGELTWPLSGDRELIVVFEDAQVAQVIVRMPWGEETVVAS